MPAPPYIRSVLGGNGVETALAQQFVEYVAMHVVDIEPGIDRAGYARQCPAAILVGEIVPVMEEAGASAGLGKRFDEPGMPIEDRAAGIKGQEPDALHRAAPY